MKDTTNRQQYNETTSRGRGRTGIEGGELLDYICEIIENREDFDICKSPVHRYAPQKGAEQYIRRKILTPEQAEQALNIVDMTLYQLYVEAIKGPSMTTDDRQVLTWLETMSPSSLNRAIEIIRSLQGDSWWIPFIDGSENLSFRERISELVYRRFSWLSQSNMDTDTYPHLSEYIPFSKLRFFAASDIPFLSAELDVPFAAFTELGLNVANYSMSPDADRTFTEYKFLSPKERNIAAIAIRELALEGGA